MPCSGYNTTDFLLYPERLVLHHGHSGFFLLICSRAYLQRPLPGTLNTTPWRLQERQLIIIRHASIYCMAKKKLPHSLIESMDTYNFTLSLNIIQS
jgi:hypothetical protein